MKRKTVSFDMSEIKTAQKGYDEVNPASPYERVILKELKNRKWITASYISKKFGYPDRSIGSNLKRMERLGILKGKWDWLKAEDGRLRKYHMYTLKK